MFQKEESEFIHKGPCPSCQKEGRDQSGDNLATYSDGHSYCFSCCSYFDKESTPLITTSIVIKPPQSASWITGASVVPLPHRKITQDTCLLYDYKVCPTSLKEVEVFYKNGIAASQHIRTPLGSFYWVGDSKQLPFYGQWLFPAGGKRLLITEGAIDCLTMSQMFGNKYPVVSIPNGVNSAAKACKENYEFIASFDVVVLCFDMDEPGQQAARAVADLLPPGKVRIMKLSRKDPNEMLLAGESNQLISSYWNASVYSPDSILHVSTVVNTTKTENKVYEFPWETLTTFMVGQDAGRLNLWAAAPGQGKTSFIREVMWQHLSEGRGVGCIFLEESPESTVDDLISIYLKKPVRRIKAQRQLNNLRKTLNKPPIASEVIDTLTDEEYSEASDLVSKLPLYLYDHVGNADLKNVLSRLDFMAVGLNCQVLIIDHITLLGNMLLTSEGDNNNERLVLDDVMKHLRALVERTGCIIHVISHIKKSDKNVDEGARLSLSDLRGSGSLAQIADNVFSLERNRQHTDDKVSNTTTIRVLKNRKTGKCGSASALLYDSKTAMLAEVPFTINQEGNMVFHYETII